MAHSAPLISTLVFGLVLAFGFGLIAQRLKLPPLIGYLLAGIAIGAAGMARITNVEAIASIASLGVVMLLFLIGLEVRPQRL